MKTRKKILSAIQNNEVINKRAQDISEQLSNKLDSEKIIEKLIDEELDLFLQELNSEI